MRGMQQIPPWVQLCKREHGHSGADEAAPSHLSGPDSGRFFQAEQHSSNGSPEGCLHTVADWRSTRHRAAVVAFRPDVPELVLRAT